MNPACQEGLPRQFLDFVTYFAFSQRERVLEAISEMEGTIYGKVASAYMIHTEDLIRSRDELLSIGDVPANLEPWLSLWTGTVFVLLGQISKADIRFAKAVETAPDDSFRCRVYVNWAGMYLTSNEQENSEVAQRAAAIIEKAMQLDPPQETKVMLTANLGLAYKMMGRYDEAAEIFETVRSFNEAQGNMFIVALATSDIADIHRRSGKLDRAVEYARSAWETMRAIDTVANDKLSLLRILIGVMRDAGNFGEAVSYASIAISMAEEARTQVVTEQERIDYFNVLHACYDEAISCYLAQKDYAQAFNLTEKARARTFADIVGDNPITVDDLHLPSDLVVVSYYSALGQLWAFVLTGDSVAAYDVGCLANVEEAFDDTGYPRNLLPGANGKLRKAWVLDRIADQVSKPLFHMIDSYKRLCVIPFGPLHHVPLSVLFNNDEVFRSPSVTVLMKTRIAGDNDTVVVLGYNGSNLAHAEAEAEAISTLTYTGESATRQAFFENAPSAKWLHLSTHGYFDVTNPMRSYIELADGPLYASEIKDGPRLNADLVVLSACDSGRNKVLGGDEPMGLIRAFMMAGASSILVTLWPVDEVATRVLMENFYTYLRSGNDPARSLALAQHRLRHMMLAELPAELSRPGLPKGKISEIVAVADDPERPFAHPYWWAGFVLVT